MISKDERLKTLRDSFHYYDEPRTYYDPIKKDVVFIGEERRKYEKKKTRAKKEKISK